MAKFNLDEVVGFYINGEFVCHQCVHPEEVENENLVMQDVVTVDDLEEDEVLFFCDRHGGRVLSK